MQRYNILASYPGDISKDTISAQRKQLLYQLLFTQGVNSRKMFAFCKLACPAQMSKTFPGIASSSFGSFAI